ncbi:MAG: hypothetical protein ACTSQA_08885 [Candidatus Heimdallarchaeaceae archaeon]
MVKKLTASEISGLLIYELRIGAFTPSYLSQAIQRGRLAHSRNGFTNTQLYSRFYKVGKNFIKIVGIPDKVDEEFVYEFKTFSSPSSKKNNLKVGAIQLLVYMFLTGLKGKLILYDVKLDKITNKIDIPFKKSNLRKVITRVIVLKNDVEKFRMNFADKQKKFQREIGLRG